MRQMRLNIAGSLLVLLVGCATVPHMPESVARQQLAAAGIELWPADKGADPYGPPSSFLEQEPDQTFGLYIRDELLTNLSVLSIIPISNLSLDCPKVTNLTPLAGLPLIKLSLRCHPEADISCIRGKRIRSLDIAYMQVRDISVIKGMPLEELWFNPYIVTNGLNFVAIAPHLDYICVCTTHDQRRSWTKKSFCKKLQHWGFHPDSPGPPPNDADSASVPVSACLTTYAGYTIARDWDLTVLPNGEVSLMIHDPGGGGAPKIRERRSRLTDDQIRTIRRCIGDNKFFTLEPVYGDDILDASSRSLCVRVGDYQRTVTIMGFNNRLIDNDPQLNEAKRLVTVWGIIRSFVKVPEECLDFSEEDRKVMEWRSPNRASAIGATAPQSER